MASSDVDVGTSGTRALAVPPKGELVAEANAPHELLTPRPGWSEQDPADWWEAAKAVLAEVAAARRRRDRRPRPDRPDARLGVPRRERRRSSARRCCGTTSAPRPSATRSPSGSARSGCSRLAGNPALTGFQAPKILWLRHHEPDAYARVCQRAAAEGLRAAASSPASARPTPRTRPARCCSTCARATGPTRSSTRSRSRATWLPKVYEGPEVTGTLRDDVADELGLPRGLPVAAGGGDNAAAAVGVGVVREGSVSSSIGTSGVMFAPPRRVRARPVGPRARVLPRRAGRLPPDGGDAVRRRLAELVARAARRRRRLRARWWARRPRSSPAPRGSCSCPT